jgi:hypothetical protein
MGRSAAYAATGCLINVTATVSSRPSLLPPRLPHGKRTFVATLQMCSRCFRRLKWVQMHLPTRGCCDRGLS